MVGEMVGEMVGRWDGWSMGRLVDGMVVDTEAEAELSSPSPTMPVWHRDWI